MKGFSTGVIVSAAISTSIRRPGLRLPYCRKHGYDCQLHLTGDSIGNLSSLFFQLLQHKSSSPFKKTETLITKLIVHTVETGIVTVITATVDLALYLSFPNMFLHIVP